MRALIVDDDDDMRALARLHMELAGVAVVGEAVDACEGVRSWMDQRPDVVILDYRMPGHSGLDAAEYILSQDASATLLLFSAYLDDTARERADRLGITYLAKDELRRLGELVASAGAAA